MLKHKIVGTAVAAGMLLATGTAGAAALKVSVDGFAGGKPIPSRFAFCIPAQPGHVTLAPNKSPKISWSKGPAATKSYAIIVTDPDAPSVATDVNKEGKAVPASLKRVKFNHWVLVDLPASVTELGEAADSDGVTAHGKPAGPAKAGVRGINDYTGWFAADDQMKGNYGGYDGPCPPWNDQRIHHYHFTVYALDVPSLGLAGTFGAPEALKAMKGHILSKGEVVGTYTLNPALRSKLAK